MYPSGESRFLAINRITIISLFALILAGGIVRSTGSGMGCPDWPKCFGQYIPPTNVSQLPQGYQEKYVAQRLAKNERFAKTLDLLGFAQLAQKILDDKTILQPEEFNVSKTWTEYINRLIGAVTGFFMLVCVFASATYLRHRKRIFMMSLLNVLLVVFQAWLGSIVVSTNLLSWVVTVHTLVALVIIGIGIYTYFQAKMLRDTNLLSGKSFEGLKIIVQVALLLSILQIALGTEVREGIDGISNAMNHLNRSEWVEGVGATFNWHRDLAIFIVAINGLIFYMVRKRYPLTGCQFRHASYIMVILSLQIVAGVVLAYLALPPMAQAAHVFLAMLLFGAQFYLLLLLKINKTFVRRVKSIS